MPGLKFFLSFCAFCIFMFTNSLFLFFVSELTLFRTCVALLNSGHKKCLDTEDTLKNV